MTAKCSVVSRAGEEEEAFRPLHLSRCGRSVNAVPASISRR